MNTQEAKALNAIVGITEMEQERDYASLAKFFADMFVAYSAKISNVLEPKEIEENYTGIHLNEDYNEDDFVKLIESFKVGNMLHAKYAARIIKDASVKLSNLPNIPVCDSRKDFCVIVSQIFERYLIKLRHQ